MTTQQLLSPFRRAIENFSMIKNSDKIAVGLSGGKDSVTLLTLLAALKRFYPKNFELVAITVDMGFDYDKSQVEALKDYCKSRNKKVPAFFVNNF